MDVFFPLAKMGKWRFEGLLFAAKGWLIIKKHAMTSNLTGIKKGYHGMHLIFIPINGILLWDIMNGIKLGFHGYISNSLGYPMGISMWYEQKGCDWKWGICNGFASYGQQRIGEHDDGPVWAPYFQAHPYGRTQDKKKKKQNRTWGCREPWWLQWLWISTRCFLR